MQGSRLTVLADIGEHGFGCIECGHQFTIGEEFVEELSGMVGEDEATEVKCPSCASVDGTSTGGES